MTNPVLYEDITSLADEPLWGALKGASLLITGATGMLGAYMALAADIANKKYGYEIRLLLMGRDRKKLEPLYQDAHAEFFFQDIREPILYKNPFDYIIHLAGPVGPIVFQDSPGEVLAVNVEGSLNLLRHITRFGCASIVLASTHEVYGGTQNERMEDDLLLLPDSMNPRACYVLGKLAAENAITGYKAPGKSARLSRLFGPLMNRNSGLFICDFINQIEKEKTICIHGDASQLRPLCYISDAASALLYILVRGENQSAYNVQGKELTTMYDVAKIIAERYSAKIILGKPETASWQPSGYWLNTRKLERLGWKPMINLCNGVDKFYRFEQNKR